MSKVEFRIVEEINDQGLSRFYPQARIKGKWNYLTKSDNWVHAFPAPLSPEYFEYSHKTIEKAREIIDSFNKLYKKPKKIIHKVNLKKEAKWDEN